MQSRFFGLVDGTGIAMTRDTGICHYLAGVGTGVGRMSIADFAFVEARATISDVSTG